MITIEYTNQVPNGQMLSTCEQDGKTLYENACKAKTKVLVLDSLDLLEEVLLASFTFDKYKTIKAHKLDKIVVVSDKPEELEMQFSRKQAVIEGVHLARMLTSEPANCLYPMAYAKRVLELKKYGLEVEILEEEALQNIGMTALLAVSQGSGYKPCVACISWKVNDEHPITVVGKGVCFDSGGLCLKPISQQYQMKWDKAAAGTVVGLMQALAVNKCPTNVVGIIGLVENMPDGKALKPGDVITTMSGQTIEIQDTDAEGRLVLADCMHYAQARFNPRMMIDLGTLTQETFASLGSAYAALYSDDVSLIKKLEMAAYVSGDPLWRMPMGEYFAKQIESPVADMKNLGNEGWGENGAAAEFLKRFVKIQSWAHIDIAGVAWTKDGPTGYGVRLLEEFIHQCP